MPIRPSVLRISPSLMAEVEAEARTVYPEECCGVLVGSCRRHADTSVASVAAVWTTENVAQGDRSHGYLIAPEVLLEVYKQAGARGEEVIGYYHSHPDAGAAPSDRDLARAVPGASYLIVAIDERQILDRRSWRLRSDNSRFEEEQLL